MILVSTSLVLNVSVVMIYNKGLSGEPLQPWIRNVLLKIAAPMVLMYMPGPKKVRREKHKPKRMNNSRPSPTNYPNVNFTQLKSYSRAFGGDNDELVLNGNKYGGKYSTSMDNHGNSHATGEQAVIVELRRMNEILASIKHDKSSMRQLQGKNTNTTSENMREWLLLTRVLDRIFFSFYIFACVLASIALMLKIQNKENDLGNV